MQLSMVEESDIDATLDARIKSGLCRCFPKDAEIFNKSRGWHGNMPDWSVIIRNGEEIAAHLGITDRTILVGKQRSRVAGIHNVFVLPEYRGKSLTKLFNAGYDVTNNILFGTDNSVEDYDVAWATEWIQRDNAITRITENWSFRKTRLMACMQTI